ncbi:hypothetical protein MERGE_002782 [Pneumocystis wakefieldiae]|uniref:dolichyl-diphosphooligosaccharide--protein glycotransferase n=1 Tax=Pneumocystis wakefieldiae TaxID=38082 RepID=A0A899FUL2_9ASCO|nr:hypothetical protein MERGE_002782 [Pneumocystis wakefieldiae]
MNQVSKTSSSSKETIKDVKGMLKILIFITISASSILPRLFSVIRYESIIHEFDPWFNFRATKYIISSSLDEFWNWFDDRTWYPLGRVTGGTLYPGLMVSSYIIHSIFHFFNYPIDIRNICVFFAPAFSSLTTIATYFFTKDLKDETSGFLAAALIAVVPGYISRSVSGSYDNEAIAITLLMLTFCLWNKAIKTGSSFFGSLTAFFYFYMAAAWGGYAFIINMIPLHCFCLILVGRYSLKIYVAYSSFYTLGTLMSMQIPFIGFQPIRSNEHMGALGIFGLIQLIAITNFIRSHISDKRFHNLLKYGIFFIFLVSFLLLIILTMMGIISPWTGRFYSLWNVDYARIHIPIIVSVSEHQPTSWSYFYFDFSLLLWLFPVGVFYYFQKLENEHVFAIIYSIMASYFSGVMVRLVLVLAPIICVSSALALSLLLDNYLVFPEIWHAITSCSFKTKSDVSISKIIHQKAQKSIEKQRYYTSSTFKTLKSTPNKFVKSWIPKVILIVTFFYYLVMFINHSTWVTSNAYSSPSVVLSGTTSQGKDYIIDDFREAYYWLKKNTPYDAKIMSWWDYGYQITGMADRITLVDNNTWNNTHIATVGKVMASPEEISYPILRKHDVDYILIIFGGYLGYSGDDINKFLWMIKIAEGVWPNEIKESDFYSYHGYRVDEHATPAMRNSLLYKMCYYNFNKIYGREYSYDIVRQQNIPSDDISLNILEEAFTTENWLVRIYKVKSPDNLGRDSFEKRTQSNQNTDEIYKTLRIN